MNQRSTCEEKSSHSRGRNAVSTAPRETLITEHQPESKSSGYATIFVCHLHPPHSPPPPSPGTETDGFSDAATGKSSSPVTSKSHQAARFSARRWNSDHFLQSYESLRYGYCRHVVYVFVLLPRAGLRHSPGQSHVTFSSFRRRFPTAARLSFLRHRTSSSSSSSLRLRTL